LNGIDAAGNARLLRVHDGRFTSDCDVLLDGREPERERQVCGFANAEPQVLLRERREARKFHAHVVGADLEGGHDERTGFGAHRRSHRAGFRVGECQRRARKSGAALVDDAAAEFSYRALCCQRCTGGSYRQDHRRAAHAYECRLHLRPPSQDMRDPSHR
jgi:hypothetical protein